MHEIINMTVIPYFFKCDATHKFAYLIGTKLKRQL